MSLTIIENASSAEQQLDTFQFHAPLAEQQLDTRHVSEHILEMHPWLNSNWKQINVTVTKGVLRQTNWMMKIIYAQTYMW